MLVALRRKVRVTILVFSLASCGDDPGADAGPNDGDATSGGTSATGGTDSAGTGSLGSACDQLLACARTGVVPVTPLEQVYGAEGTCWDMFDAQDCELDCIAQMNVLHAAHPTRLECAPCVASTEGTLACVAEASGESPRQPVQCQQGAWQSTWDPADALCREDGYDFAVGCDIVGGSIEFSCADGPGTPCDAPRCSDDASTLYGCVDGRTTENDCQSLCDTTVAVCGPSGGMLWCICDPPRPPEPETAGCDMLWYDCLDLDPSQIPDIEDPVFSMLYRGCDDGCIDVTNDFILSCSQGATVEERCASLSQCNFAAGCDTLPACVLAQDLLYEGCGQ